MNEPWRIERHDAVASTNDEAAALRDGGAKHRVAVVADRQTRGRGREGRDFASPAGGLYASLLLRVPAQWVPHYVVAGIAVAACEAIESAAPTEAKIQCGIKWPNDLWIQDRKVGGILLEAAGADAPLIVGIGINIAAVPGELDPAVGQQTTSLVDEGAAVSRDVLLASLLDAIDARLPDWASPASVTAWRERLVWIGRRVHLTHAGTARSGVLEAIDLVRGLLVRMNGADATWLAPAHVQDLRLA